MPKTPPKQTEGLADAFRHYEDGRFDRAETIAAGILDGDSGAFGAAYLLGVIAYETGRFEDAARYLGRATAINPDSEVAHHNLGLVHHQTGDLDAAADSLGRALAIRPGFAEAHCNLGNVRRDQGDPAAAAEAYGRSLDLNPDFADAHFNLGIVLADLGRPGDAVAAYERALALNPDFADAHYNLGIALAELNRFEEAVSANRRATALDPGSAAAFNNLGNALRDLGRTGEAVAAYGQALALDPRLAAAHGNLGGALRQLGRPDDAIASYRRALAADPDDDALWHELSMSLNDASPGAGGDALGEDLLRLTERSRVRPEHVVAPATAVLRRHPDIGRLLARTRSEGPAAALAYGEWAPVLSDVRLLLAIMVQGPIFDLEIEAMLTALRRAMIEAAVDGEGDAAAMPFTAALARHCFINEYVFAETAEETTAVGALERRIAGAMEDGGTAAAPSVLALACYRPLHVFPWAGTLAAREWPETVAQVLTQQVSEPLQEEALQADIPSLSAIDDAVSRDVRRQYEQNPYPRWVKTHRAASARPIGRVLGAAPLFLDLGDYRSPENPDILVAGCGTGRHTLELRARFLGARILAVDLSRRSLAYAMRKAREFGVDDIEFGHGDILTLGALGRRFDLIDAVGVLHHLGDPVAGWRGLVDMLAPKGVMRIGLYSETARRFIAHCRSRIGETGDPASPDFIRRCRAAIADMAESPERSKLLGCGDFYSLSECRDMLFHVQEHQFTLPGIAEALESLGLRFLGFELSDPAVMRRFEDFHGDGAAPASLSQWHRFETAKPDTFRAMYQFWCQRT